MSLLAMWIDNENAGHSRQHKYQNGANLSISLEFTSQ